MAYLIPGHRSPDKAKRNADAATRGSAVALHFAVRAAPMSRDSWESVTLFSIHLCDTVCVYYMAEAIMGKYEPLGAFLREQRAQEVPLTFNEIEKITGVKLPPKAQHHRAWWSNNASNNVMTKVWLEAGYESTQVDMSARKLVFRRVGKGGTAEEKERPKKGERHPLFGALKDVTFIPPGVDLTEPADPDWGKVYED